MILGLPIDDIVVYGLVSSDGWRDNIGVAISIRPLDVALDETDKKSLGIHSGWVTAHFQNCL
jgi:hypothetical protein